MKGDFSRQTFDPARHYSGVLMQQGRVQLDADWNEAQAARRYREQTEATDVIGSCGAPENFAGFAITVQDSTLMIGAGRYYVDGILCENGTLTNNASISYTQQPDLPDAPDVVALLQDQMNPLGLVYLDVWQRHLTALDDPSIREQALGSDGPDTTTRIKNVWQVKVLPVTLDLTPLIDVLKAVQGELQNIAIDRSTDFTKQAGTIADYISTFLSSTNTVSQWLEKVIEFYGGVIDQLLTLLNIAPDLASRVEVERLILELEGSFLEFEANLCKQSFAEWNALKSPPARTLNARTQPTGSTDNPCLLPPTAGYQRLENQLYRVEILQGGDPSKDTVSFVWSRDNGSVVTLITASVHAGDTTVMVDSLGPDNELGFAKTQTVEILDDSLELYGLAGQLATITDINLATHVVTLDRALNAVNAQLHAKMRRWDGFGQVTIPASADDWIALEGGIQVQFAAGTYQTGDYWLIPARTASGLIEWPTSSTDGSPIAQPPLGIRHHYCRLALIWLEQENLHPVSPPVSIGNRPIVRGLVNSSPVALRTHPFSLFNRVLDSIDASIVGGVNRPGFFPIAVFASPPPASTFLVWDCRTLFPALTTVPPAMHVIQTNWQNDSIIPVQQFLLNGLLIFLDEVPDPNSLVDGATVIVTLGTQATQTGINGTTAIILSGTIETVSNAIWWRYTPSISSADVRTTMVESFAASALSAYTIYVTLKGRAIWQAGTWQPASRPYLDGLALGLPGAQEKNVDGFVLRTLIDLSLPSGMGVRASDFESWFYLGNLRTGNPFQVSSVNFLAVTTDTLEPPPVHTIQVPPVPASTDPKVQFNTTDQINAIDITFNRAVSSEGFGPDDLQKGLSLDLVSAGTTNPIVGTVNVKQDGVSVRFTDVGQQPLPAGLYQLRLISIGAGGPLVKAADDDATLDGDFNMIPGGDFVLPFSIAVPVIIK